MLTCSAVPLFETIAPILKIIKRVSVREAGGEDPAERCTTREQVLNHDTHTSGMRLNAPNRHENSFHGGVPLLKAMPYLVG